MFKEKPKTKNFEKLRGKGQTLAKTIFIALKEKNNNKVQEILRNIGKRIHEIIGQDMRVNLDIDINSENETGTYHLNCLSGSRGKRGTLEITYDGDVILKFYGMEDIKYTPYNRSFKDAVEILFDIEADNNDYDLELGNIND